MFSTDLNREYQVLAEQGFLWEELWHLNLNVLDASFLPAAEKAIYREEWQRFADGVDHITR
jgi:adenosine deaminase